MPSPRHSLAAAAAALGLVWLTAPGVPLYDGVGLPDEPYRYVHPPAGARRTAPPTSASWQAKAAHGRCDDFVDARSGELGPQVEISASPGGFKGAPTVRSFSLAADPIAAEPAPGYAIDGNVYRVRITSTPPGPVTAIPATDHTLARIALRATSAKPPVLTFLFRPTPTTPWKRQSTEKTGNDVFATDVAGAGDYVLARVPQSALQQVIEPGSDSHRLTAVLLAVTFGLIIAAVGGIRAVRSRAQSRAEGRAQSRAEGRAEGSAG